MNYYYDTSALCRNYHPEAGSDKIEQLLQDSNSRHVISRVTYLELQSAFALKVRTGEISAGDFTLLRRRFRADVNRRTLKVVRLLRRHYDRAEKVLLRHAMSKRLRTLDSIHLAVALDFGTPDSWMPSLPPMDCLFLWGGLKESRSSIPLNRDAISNRLSSPFPCPESLLERCDEFGKSRA